MHLISFLVVWVGAVLVSGNPVTPPKTIVEVASEQGCFTFVDLLTKADLRSTLEGPGPYTIFVPSDKAFQSVDFRALDAIKSNQELLKNLIKAHVVEGTIATTDFLDGLSFTPLLETYSLDIQVDDKELVKVNGADVVSSDFEGSNGVIHIINKVFVSAGQVEGQNSTSDTVPDSKNGTEPKDLKPTEDSLKNSTSSEDSWSTSSEDSKKNKTEDFPVFGSSQPQSPVPVDTPRTDQDTFYYSSSSPKPTTTTDWRRPDEGRRNASGVLPPGRETGFGYSTTASPQDQNFFTSSSPGTKTTTDWTRPVGDRRNISGVLPPGRETAFGFSTTASPQDQNFFTSSSQGTKTTTDWTRPVEGRINTSGVLPPGRETSFGYSTTASPQDQNIHNVQNTDGFIGQGEQYPQEQHNSQAQPGQENIGGQEWFNQGQTHNTNPQGQMNNQGEIDPRRQSTQDNFQGQDQNQETNQGQIDRDSRSKGEMNLPPNQQSDEFEHQADLNLNLEEDADQIPSLELDQNTFVKPIQGHLELEPNNEQDEGDFVKEISVGTSYTDAQFSNLNKTSTQEES